MAGHGVQQRTGVIAREDQLAVRGMEKACGHGPVAKLEKGIEIAIGIEQRDGLVMEAQLSPGESLKQLVERAPSAGQGEEGAGEFVHERLAVVHGFDDMEASEPGVGHLLFNESLRDDANDLAAGGERGIGERSHEPDAGASIDEAQAAAGDRLPGEARSIPVDVEGAGA